MTTNGKSDRRMLVIMDFRISRNRRYAIGEFFRADEL